MESNGPLLQPAEIISYLQKKRPQTPSDPFGMMVQLVWNVECLYDSNGMVWSDMVLERQGYGMGFSSQDTMEWVWSCISPPRMGTLTQRIGPPHRYPKMGDWSAVALEFFLIQKVFMEELSKSYAEEIQGAFADYWDKMWVLTVNLHLSLTETNLQGGAKVRWCLCPGWNHWEGLWMSSTSSSNSWLNESSAN